MKKDSVLSVLMYIFNHHLQQGKVVELTSDEVTEDLESAGFGDAPIEQAIEWLSSLAEMDKEAIAVSSPDAIRVFSEEEKQYLDSECQAFLLDLIKQVIISPATFEVIVYFLVELDADDIDVSLAKWVTLMVLYNMPDEQEAFKQMELLVLDDSPTGVIH
ncbi:MAG: hypothetical protein CL816_02280 [Coxiellaceae bacterium]|nr:hypothetical protein [Coxiellaceae bacterium]